MYHPTRGGVRGGRDQFSWDQVKTDKDRECYLGHSLMAPVGRWQQGKDLTWYAKDNDSETSGNDATNKSNEEFRKAKELEEQALMAALGYQVVKKEPKVTTHSPETIPSCKPFKHNSEHPNSKLEIHSHELRTPAKFIKLDNKKALDSMLLKLVYKHGLKAVIKALGGDTDSLKSSRKKKKKKSKRKNAGSTSSSSSSS